MDEFYELSEEAPIPERREHAVFRKVMNSVIDERNYQRTKWATEHDQNHTPEEWLTILGAYMGKAALETPIYHGNSANPAGFKKRLTQVAAICVAALEAMANDVG
jgi:hypothetical protein